ncbi:hypothetical protein B0H67DRAFT_383556 [Lasiosphaeris hirsuta]|uniref:Uncharacterized protein n=1 Tax=Lasiosphaeris hirsuta TaxID=260670 RepID=A0AA40DMM0_9PEZI|nr:hypothetical protein B0H67DRAFT_383556 [Lasiosphaeris hirsuta]
MTLAMSLSNANRLETRNANTHTHTHTHARTLPTLLPEYFANDATFRQPGEPRNSHEIIKSHTFKPVQSSNALTKFSLTSRASARDRNEKRKEKDMAGQTSVDTHPARAPESKTSKTGYRSSPTLYTAAVPETSDHHPCGRSESKMVLTVGRRGYESSSRVGFVALLGNTKEDDYYRNDSSVAVVSGGCGEVSSKGWLTEVLST